MPISSADLRIHDGEVSRVRGYPTMMDAKLAVTTHCNGRCLTCPVGFLSSRYGETMPYDRFVECWDLLNASPRIGRIILNGTGELYTIPDHIRYLKYAEAHHTKHVVLQTNAELLDYVPTVETLVISYNGGSREAYEATTGMSHDRMRMAILRRYDDLARIPTLELHVLICALNAHSEAEILTTWAHFPGRIRVSYKYDNQMQKDRTLPMYQCTDRIFCDYLDGLSIWPDGTLISCAHDMRKQTNWGNIFVDGIEWALQHPERVQKRVEHHQGRWRGLCERCNYNTPIGNRVRYLR